MACTAPQGGKEKFRNRGHNKAHRYHPPLHQPGSNSVHYIKEDFKDGVHSSSKHPKGEEGPPNHGLIWKITCDHFCVPVFQFSVHKVDHDWMCSFSFSALFESVSRFIVLLSLRFIRSSNQFLLFNILHSTRYIIFFRFCLTSWLLTKRSTLSYKKISSLEQF